MRYFLPHLIEQEGARQNHRKKQWPQTHKYSRCYLPFPLKRATIVPQFKEVKEHCLMKCNKRRFERKRNRLCSNSVDLIVNSLRTVCDILKNTGHFSSPVSASCAARNKFKLCKVTILIKPFQYYNFFNNLVMELESLHDRGSRRLDQSNVKKSWTEDQTYECSSENDKL